MKFTLRPYQNEVVAQLRTAFRSGSKAPLLVMPTGSGKTVVFAFIAESASSRGGRILILQHRKELIRQASITLGSIGVRHQVVSPVDKVTAIRAAHVKQFGWPMIDKESHVAVASVQTLGRRLEFIEEFKPTLIIVDEAHHATSTQFRKVIESCLVAYPDAMILGVTATAGRLDGQGLGVKSGGIFDSIVLGPSPKQLIELGNLCRPRVFAPPTKIDLSQVHMRGSDFDARELSDAVDKPVITGGAIDHYKRVADGKPAIVFCASLKHAEHVAQEFQAAGYRFEVIHGGMDGGDRDRLVYSLADGRIQGLVSIDVLSEGVDVPVAEVCIALRPTQSESMWLQQVGRVMRPAEGKEYGIILDHVGNTFRHGMPDSDRDWTLNGRRKKKRGAKDEADFVVVQCPECYSTHDPAAKCPYCGHVYTVRAGGVPETVAGTLQEVSVDAMMLQKIEARKAQGQAKTVEQLAQAGISRDRATHILQAREEKDRLQKHLRDLLTQWRDQNHERKTILEGWGFMYVEIAKMKPKQLRETIERVNEALLALDPNHGKMQIRNAY